MGLGLGKKITTATKPIENEKEFLEALDQDQKASKLHRNLRHLAYCIEEMELKISPQEAHRCVGKFLEKFSERNIERAYTERERQEIKAYIYTVTTEPSCETVAESQVKLKDHLLKFDSLLYQAHTILPEEAAPYVSAKLKELNIVRDPTWQVRDILMSYPDDRGDTEGNPDKWMAHSIITEVLKQSGANVTKKGNIEGRYNSSLGVFVRDPVIADHLNKKVYFAGPAGFSTSDLAKNFSGYELISLDYLINQGGDVQAYLHNKGQREGLWIASYLGDSHKESLERLSKEQNLEMILLPQASHKEPNGEPARNDSRFYHLDTFFSALPNGEVLIYETATTQEACDALKKRVGEKNYIAISKEDAGAMATNLESVGNILTMPYCSEELEKTLKDKGYEIVTPDKLGLPFRFFSFQKGAVHCMTNELTMSDEMQRSVKDAQNLMKAAWENPTIAAKPPMPADRKTTYGV